jgi:hypothetical protein
MLEALSTRRPPITVLPALLLVGVALWEVCAARCDADGVPGDEAWERAAQVVRADLRPGDLIVFAPDWVDPVGRLHLGDRISLEMAGRMDAARYARIWELSIRGARAPETGSLVAAFERVEGGVTVRRYERAPVEVVSDVRDRVSEAKIGGGHASLELAEVGFAPHRCVQVTPAPGQPVRLTFPQLPLGTTLVGYVGLADVFTRRDIRAPGKLEVELGGRVIASATPGVDDGWVRFEAATQPGAADVTFVASADAPQRQICFAAEARR